ncbi:hypothetical protein Sme01_12460 [Sphaerisporangium melleum]|uniref:Siderophore biosynthesis protein n=1 Tax=Sphaerisporangium melleum TaxID=321316 RepID=A0A917RI49_9ACTN|nr:IucA/IucC family protein [Sphaerisporangium melleum]GGL08906.1 hypothetical protein GCM10007964_58970 [Sphaerisporangium melleum]GII68770.1 hypothetical protein Sme01_12460 [Sphaerisporangium melleum]
MSRDPSRGAPEPYLAARVLDALIREDYGGLAGRVTRGKDAVQIVLPAGRRVRLVPGRLYQDFRVAPEESLTLAEVIETLMLVADSADAEGVAAFAAECHAALRAYELHDRHRGEVLARVRHALRPAARGIGTTIAYETLAAFADHPVHPASRARPGLTDDQLLAYAPEFAPSFPLRWAAVPSGLVTAAGGAAAACRDTSVACGADGHRAGWTDGHRPGRRNEHGAGRDGGEPGGLPGWWPAGDGTTMMFPVHPLTAPAVREIPGVILLDAPHLTVRPTLSMRTVEVDARTHLKLPLPISTLGARNRRSIKPGTLEDGARAESLLREVLRREPDLPVLLADEQTYAHTGHEYLGWMLRRLPPGEIVSVAALPAPSPACGPGGGLVLDELAARYRGGDTGALLDDYLRVLFAWNVRLLVGYGIALEAHQQNLALVFDDHARLRLLVKDNDGLLVAPDRLRAAGLAVPDFADRRLLTDDPHALADVFVTITLHLAAAAVASGAGRAERVAEALDGALAEHGDHPMARLLRARTLDADRLTGKAMVSAATLMARTRVAADVNKHYGAGGPNYLRHRQRREANS